jgi:hypothetical protein
MIDNFFYILYRNPLDNLLYVKLKKGEDESIFQLPERSFDNEEALVRHEFKFMKDQINRGKIQIANMSIIDEYQELFTEVLNEQDDEIDAWANLLNDIVDHPINN